MNFPDMKNLAGYADKIEEKTYCIIDKDGKAVTVVKNGSSYGYALTEATGADNQKFKVTAKGDCYEISSLWAEGYNVDVCGCSSADGANILVYKSNGSSAQRFKFEKAADGFYITTAASGYKKCIGVTGGALKQTSAKDLSSCWKFKKV